MRNAFCPFCRKLIFPELVEKNLIARDIYKCPQCGKRILKCMKPGCNRFAKGGDHWDDNFCPICGFSDDDTHAYPTNAKTITVRTKNELETAINNKIDIINVEGEVAKQLIAAKVIKTLSPIAIAGLAAAIAAAPATGGASALLALPAIAALGLSEAAILALIALGVFFVLAILKDYEELEVKLVPPSIKLQRKQSA